MDERMCWLLGFVFPTWFLALVVSDLFTGSFLPTGYSTASESRDVDKAPTGNVDTDTDGSTAATTQSYYAHYSSANSTESTSDR